MAKLHFKYGAMNCGKSDTLIKTAFNYTESGLEVVVVKPATDTKGGDFVTSRGGFQRKVDILAHSDLNLRDAILALAKERGATLQCILADEAQFFTPTQVDQLYTLAKHDNISVITYGLRTNVYRRLFRPGIPRLLELADNIEKIPTMCRCGSQAEFNARYVNGVFDYQDEGDPPVIIDGATDNTLYTSFCGPCYDAELADSRSTKSQQ